VLKLVDQRGAVTGADMQTVRAAGFDDAELVELIAHTALNLYTNYLNIALDVPVSQVIDFPLHGCDEPLS
jgi:alkylhydroperoxidase family enzyme